MLKKIWNVFLVFISYRTVIAIVGVLVGILGTLSYVQIFGIPSQKVLQNISKAEEEKVIQEIVENAAKLIVLPKGEEPVMATITDADALIKEQPFYLGSKNGDVVLMYQKALKAIIYSPERNIIVNVGPITPQENAQAEQVTPTESEATSTPEKKK
jgi:hypothetical protein